MPATGTMTQTTTSERASEGIGDEQLSLPAGTLRLRGAPQTERRGIRWAEDVVDNEGMGRKKSKVCCIYHKPRAVGESSDESSDSSSSDSNSDSEPDNSTARRSGGARRRGLANEHTHNPEEGCCHSHGEGSVGGNTPEGNVKARRKKSPNAYEKMPRKEVGKGHKS
ncbi:MAG: hypothetical protein M1812_007166 [Candelaria pacifica]|nr:MAG: hypothetical protein M1812_007166 [Candelaria pacifica]